MNAQDRTTATRLFTTRAGRNVSFTALGFGSAPLGNYLRALSEEECDATLTAAWDSGLRYYDTAPLYGLGLSEQRVGRLLRTQPRAAFTISSKVGRLLEPCAPEEVNGLFFVHTPQVRFVYDYSYAGVMRSYEASLRRLGLDRVDILYVHDVDAFCHGGRAASEARIRELLDTGGWRALDELRRNGDVAAIGVGVNEWEPCARMLELADPDLFLLAGRYTLLEQEALERFLPRCEREGVSVIVGGAFNSGILATGARPGARYNYAPAPPDVLARVDRIAAVCARHGVRLPAAALAFPLTHPAVACVIPGMAAISELETNLELLAETVPPDLYRDLKREGLMRRDAPTP
jgi:D-threo-aldose 1-dehydrogenase